ncbi:MAG: response regulator transcription factor [Flavobacteriales bacterium]|nr:response regulator transcription factor [Flavobacteriales bacterium]
MNKVTAIIVDDEQRARDVLNTLLDRNCPNVSVIATCVDVLSAVEKIKEVQPDVVFLDVQMPNYAGYELVKFFDEITFEIIFVTAFDHYAIKAFELNAIDYLVKPVDRLRLVDAVERVAIKVGREKSKEEYEELLNSIKNKEYKKIVIPELGDRRVLEINKIIAIEAEGSYCKIYQPNDKPVVISKNLKYFEERLEVQDGFFRSHRGWLINLNHIKAINKTELTLTLSNNLTAKISRTRLEAFETQIV